MTTPNGILDFISENSRDGLPPQVPLERQIVPVDLIGVGGRGPNKKMFCNNRH